MAGFDPKAYRQAQAAQYTGSAPAAPAPVVPKPETSIAGSVFKPFQESGIITADRATKDKQSFLRRVGEDALLLGLAPAAIVGTAGDLLLHPIKTGRSIAKGFVDGYIQMADGREWKEHPLLNTVNTIANISVVGGLIKSAALNSARSSTLQAAERAAIEAGADSTVASTVFSGKKALKNSVFEATKSGSIEPVVTGLRPYFEQSGLSREAADSAARQVATEHFGTWLTENKASISRMDAVAHPVAAFGTASARISAPIREAVFGTPERSAVGKLYGSEVVRQDLPGFGMVEEWASMQTAERGVADTVSNRVRSIQEWADANPEYAALTPTERVKHLQNYAEADLTRQRFAEGRGRDYVLTKALPKHYVEAMSDFVRTLPEKKPDGNPWTNAEVLNLLEEHYGNDFRLHSQEVRSRMQGDLESTLDRGAITSSIETLGNTRIPVSLSKMTPEEMAFVSDLEGSGYRIGRAPTGKKISQAADITGTKFSKDELVSARTTIGRLVDRLGLSPEGVVEGTQMFGFREAFTQSLLKKYGDTASITVNGIKIPVQSMATNLEKYRVILEENRSGVFPGKHTISDLRMGDLLKMGFSKEDAIVLDKIIRESSVASPSITGIGEAVANYARTRNNPLSRAYNSFLRVQSDLRFKKNPMFGMQAAIESVVWGSLFTKTIPGKGILIKSLEKVKGLHVPIKNSIAPTTIQEEAAVMSEVMSKYTRQLRDSGMSPEIYQGFSDVKTLAKPGIEGYRERAQFENRNLDSNIWLGAAGFSNVRLTTNLMKAYSARFGVSLEEALTFKMVDGKKVYKNPWLVENMQNAAQSIFGYKEGVLNSPMIRTLNTVFFPVRFQTKTLINTSEWLSSLSPMQRLAVVNGWTNMASWLGTDEGQKWKNTNRPIFTNLFNYAFAYEGIGKSLDAVTKGQLFGGNTGLIGGLPFGFIANIATDLGYGGQDKQINTTTGLPYQREVVKDTASFSGFVTAVENILLSMSPSMPFYTATGGVITVSLNRGLRTFVDQTLAAAAGANPFDDKDYKDYQNDINRGKKKVKSEFTKWSPNPI
jgi:hypothetical protein